jgi:20S proteasome subunit alpha 7
LSVCLILTLIACVSHERTVIALRGKDGVVLAVEKLVTSKLYEEGANKRIFNVDKHIGVAVAGLLADARAVVEIARKEANNYRSLYGVGIPVKVSVNVWMSDC